MYKLLIVLLITILFTACGGGGGSGGSNGISNKTGYLIDSAINGVEYTCGDISGITGENGEFTYNNNCKVTFKLGGIVLGNIDGSSINDDNSVLPADLLGLERENTSDIKIINLIQFLQSIDDDDNPDNNIVISKKTIQAFKDCTLDFRTQSNHLEEIKEVIVLINKKLVTKENALKHYEGVLSKRFGIDIETNNENIDEVLILDEKKEEKGFSYKNQRDVRINIVGISSQIDKQVLLYEKLKIVSTPVGNLETLENLIISTILDDDGNFQVKQTFANHIQSIWLVIPYYRIQVEVPIVNNNIYFKIDKEGY